MTNQKKITLAFELNEDLYIALKTYIFLKYSGDVGLNKNEAIQNKIISTAIAYFLKDQRTDLPSCKSLEFKIDDLALDVADIENRENSFEKRLSKIEKFIRKRLDQIISNKIEFSETYLTQRIDILSDELENLDNKLEDIRNNIPNTSDIDSKIKILESTLNDLDSRMDNIETKIDI